MAVLFMEKYIFILKSAGIAVHGISGSFSENRPSLHMGNKHQKVKAVFKIFLSSHPNPKNLTPFVKAAQNGSIEISHRLIQKRWRGFNDYRTPAPYLPLFTLSQKIIVKSKKNTAGLIPDGKIIKMFYFKTSLKILNYYIFPDKTRQHNDCYFLFFCIPMPTCDRFFQCCPRFFARRAKIKKSRRFSRNVIKLTSLRQKNSSLLIFEISREP